VPTVYLSARSSGMVGTLRFAHPAISPVIVFEISRAI
jgi:hypothetical protein